MAGPASRPASDAPWDTNERNVGAMGRTIMLERHKVGWLLISALLPALPGAARSASAQDKAVPQKPVKAAGILFDYNRQANWITVKSDGEDEPVKYLIDPADRRLADALTSVFNASRVQLTYRTDRDSRYVVGIKRQVLKASGTVTGVVVNVHNDFWIELKPRQGPADAFAPGANYNDKAFMAQLKALKPGDSVTIQYTTDFERHRIQALRKNSVPGKPGTNRKDSGV
jgi:hypothetical protein